MTNLAKEDIKGENAKKAANLQDKVQQISMRGIFNL